MPHYSGEDERRRYSQFRFKKGCPYLSTISLLDYYGLETRTAMDCLKDKMLILNVYTGSYAEEACPIYCQMYQDWWNRIHQPK